LAATEIKSARSQALKPVEQKNSSGELQRDKPTSEAAQDVGWRIRSKKENLMAATEASGEAMKLSTERDDWPRTEPGRRCCATPSGTSEEAGNKSEGRTRKIKNATSTEETGVNDICKNPQPNTSDGHQIWAGKNQPRRQASDGHVNGPPPVQRTECTANRAKNTGAQAARELRKSRHEPVSALALQAKWSQQISRVEMKSTPPAHRGKVRARIEKPKWLTWDLNQNRKQKRGTTHKSNKN
jgi:hypothetical protein